MIVAACWAIAVIATAAYGLLLTTSEAIAQRAAPVFLVLVLPCWLYLAHHYERTHRRDA